MNAWEAVVLGVVQGLTEFLPVSSSGHLVVGQALLGIELPGVEFEVAVHFATLVSVLVAYRGRVGALMRGSVRLDPGTWRYLGLITLANVPAAAVYFLLGDAVEAAFETPAAVGVAFLATGAVLWSARAALRRGSPQPGGAGMQDRDDGELAGRFAGGPGPDEQLAASRYRSASTRTSPPSSARFAFRVVGRGGWRTRAWRSAAWRPHRKRACTLPKRATATEFPSIRSQRLANAAQQALDRGLRAHRRSCARAPRTGLKVAQARCSPRPLLESTGHARRAHTRVAGIGAPEIAPGG